MDNIVDTLKDVKKFLTDLPIEDVRFIMLLHDKWFFTDDEEIMKKRNQVDEDNKSSMINWLIGTDPIAEQDGLFDFIHSLGEI